MRTKGTDVTNETKAQHTPGMIFVGPDIDNDGFREVPIGKPVPGGFLVVAVAIGGLVGQDENARRLAAAWNACQGVPVEVLEANASGGLPWHVADQIDQIGIRRELVAALEEARTGLLWYQDRHPGSADGVDPCHSLIVAAVCGSGSAA